MFTDNEFIMVDSTEKVMEIFNFLTSQWESIKDFNFSLLRKRN